MVSTAPKTVSDVDTALILEKQKRKSEQSREIYLEMEVFSISVSAYSVCSGY